MKDILLENTYALVQAKQFLLSEGYSNEEINTLIEEGKIWDAVKGAGKKAGRYAAMGAAAAGMMGGSMAHGSEISDAAKDLHDNAPRISQGISDEAYAQAGKDQRALESLIDQSAQKAFKGNISDDALKSLKMVISRLDFRDPSKARKAVQIIVQTAQKLGGDGQSQMDVYNTANQISYSLSR